MNFRRRKTSYDDNFTTFKCSDSKSFLDTKIPKTVFNTFIVIMLKDFKRKMGIKYTMAFHT